MSRTFRHVRRHVSIALILALLIALLPVNPMAVNASEASTLLYEGWEDYNRSTDQMNGWADEDGKRVNSDANAFQGSKSVILNPQHSIKKTVNASVYGEMELSYYVRFTSLTSADSLIAEISVDGETNWITVDEIKGGEIPNTTWRQRMVSVPDTADNAESLVLRFRSDTAASRFIRLDEIRLTGKSTVRELLNESFESYATGAVNAPSSLGPFSVLKWTAVRFNANNNPTKFVEMGNNDALTAQINTLGRSALEVSVSARVVNAADILRIQWSSDGVSWSQLGDSISQQGQNWKTYKRELPEAAENAGDIYIRLSSSGTTRLDDVVITSIHAYKPPSLTLTVHQTGGTVQQPAFTVSGSVNVPANLSIRLNGATVVNSVYTENQFSHTLPLLQGPNEILIDAVNVKDHKAVPQVKLSVTYDIGQQATGKFYVNGTQIIDPDGSEFVAKGVNVHGYNTPWPVDTLNEIDLIADVWKFNSVRLYARINPDYNNGNGNQKDMNYFHALIDEFTARKVVVMIEVHDQTGKYFTEDTVPSLQDLKTFYQGLAQRYKDNTYVWFNIMNEPGGQDKPVNPLWKTMHEEVIQTIRATGATDNIIVLDGSSWAQDSAEFNNNPVVDSNSAILTYGQDMLNYNRNLTGNTNIVFSVHLYREWIFGESKLIDYLDRVAAKGLALVVGEYGEWTNNDTRDATRYMFKQVIPRKIGRYVWHWFGGDQNKLTVNTTRGGGKDVRLVNGEPTNLSWLGRKVWNDNHGLPVPTDSIDLSLSSIIADKSAADSSSTISFQTTVRNDGDLPVNGTVTIRYYVNGELASSKDAIVKLGNREQTVVVSNPIAYPSSNFTIRAEIDSAASSYGQDADLNNNAVQQDVLLSAAAPGVDLAVTAIRSNPSLPALGDQVAVEVVITNRGTGQANGMAIGGNIHLNGVSQKTISTNQPLAPGESITLSDYTFIPSDYFYTVDFRLNNNYKGVDANLSNDSLFVAIPVTPPTEIRNLLINPGFEDGLTGWNNFTSGSNASVEEQARTGQRAFVIRDDSSGGRGQAVALLPNTTYILGAWGKFDVLGQIGDVGVKFLPQGAETHTQYFLHFTTTEYEYKELEFTTPNLPMTDSKVFAYKNNKPNNFYVDDVLFAMKPYTAEPPSLPEAPGNLRVTSKTETSVTLAWNAVEQAESYAVLQGGSQIANVTQATYTVTGLTSGTTYIFAVKAVNGNGVFSEPSGVLTVTTDSSDSSPPPTPPSTPPATPPAQNEKQVVNEASLKNGKEGKVSIEIAKGTKQVLLPAKAADAVGNQKLELVLEAAKLIIPPSVMKTLQELAGAQANADISLQVEPLDIQQSIQQGQATLAVAGDGVQLKLQVVTGSGSQTLSEFAEPIELELSYKAGSKPSLLGVYYYNPAAEQWEYVGGKVDQASGTITVSLVHFSKYAVFEYNKSYDDLHGNHWAYDAVQALSAKHVVKGVSDSRFAPEGTTTRAEFAALLSRVLQLKNTKSAPFTDVAKDAWYADEVAAAFEAGLIHGRGEDTFAPHATITREEMAVMLMRAYEKAKGTKPQADRASFKDLDRASSWATGSIQAAASIGLMNGKGSQLFDPTANTNRAETAKAVHNLIQLLD